MISNQNILRVSNALCAGAVVLSPLLVFRVIGMSGIFAFSMHAGIIFTGWALMYKQTKTSEKWNGAVPLALQYLLPAMAISGIAGIAFGFAGVLPDSSPSGEPVRHLNAYFENGLCYATFNKNDAIRMPAEFCRDFETHFSTAFSGFWLLFSAVLNWAAWRCQGKREVA
jgi:hypothetical protein